MCKQSCAYYTHGAAKLYKVVERRAVSRFNNGLLHLLKDELACPADVNSEILQMARLLRLLRALKLGGITYILHLQH